MQLGKDVVKETNKMKKKKTAQQQKAAKTTRSTHRTSIGSCNFAIAPRNCNFIYELLIFLDTSENCGSSALCFVIKKEVHFECTENYSGVFHIDHEQRTPIINCAPAIFNGVEHGTKSQCQSETH